MRRARPLGCQYFRKYDHVVYEWPPYWGKMINCVDQILPDPNTSNTIFLIINCICFFLLLIGICIGSVSFFDMIQIWINIKRFEQIFTINVSPEKNISFDYVLLTEI